MPRVKTYWLCQHTKETIGGTSWLTHAMYAQRSVRAPFATDNEAVSWAVSQIRSTPDEAIVSATDVWQLCETFKTRGKQARPVATWEGDLLALVRRELAEVAS